MSFTNNMITILRNVGNKSLELYLVHMIILPYFSFRYENSLYISLLALAVSFALAYIFYYALHNPLIDKLYEYTINRW